MVDKKVTAIIPARGGSKRIHKKNIIEVAGKPMIAWTIEAALESQHIDEVVISTDDEEIAEVSKEFGAKVPFLRDENADDHSPVSLATIRTLQQLEASGEERPDLTVQLMANCPLRNASDIDKAVENFITKNHDFQISCFKYGWMNPLWAHRMNERGIATPVFPEEIKKRSQDQPELYCPTGAIWIAKTDELFKNETFYGPAYAFFPLHWKKAIDIDETEDLEMANFFMRKI